MAPSAVRVLTSAVAGVGVGLACGLLAPWQLSLLLGWVAAASVFLIVVWRSILRADGSETERTSTAEDDSRAARGLIVVSASLASLGGAAAALQKAAGVDGRSQAALLTVAAVATLVVSWLGVHTEFTLRYAHLYYTPPRGGIAFDGVDLPNYRDFAYLAFTIGMTYQVSDTGLLTVRFRRVVVAHAFVSYLFGAVIIAAAINVVAGLIR